MLKSLNYTAPFQGLRSAAFFWIFVDSTLIELNQFYHIKSNLVGLFF